MKITYKDVGQGDSIILEWERDGKSKVGIIDCNRKGKANPVLEHIVAKAYSEIEFIILSHPHKDHYSGMLQLLHFLESKGISINRFCNTLHWSATDYWKYFEVGNSDSRLLKKIIGKVRELKNTKQIKRIDALGCGNIIRIEVDLTLECLAPSHDDAEEYQRIVKTNADKNIKEASQAANHLSTIFKLCIGEYGVLFTSDAESLALEGLIERELDNLTASTFQICQLPHHGSINNHYPTFWKMLLTTQTRFAIISAGKHRSYNHPSLQVIEAFNGDGYLVHCTNFVNGMQEFTEHLQALVDSSIELDSGSVLAEEYRKAGDRVFKLTDTGFVLE
jgi:competence protein ComEC